MKIRLSRSASIIAAAGLAAALPGAGAAPPAGDGAEKPETVTKEGFVPIFNGKDLTGWDGDPALWRVEDGTITGETTAANPIPYNKFIHWRDGELDDFELKVEYRISGGNSGIQYRSFVLPDKEYAVGGYQADFDAERNWAGTNYGEQFRGILAKRGQKTVINEDGKPEVTGSLGEPGELQARVKDNDWNEYHIIARGNHFVQKINGVVMSDVTDNDTDTRRRSGILAFQIHKGPPMVVRFRNIRLKRLPLEDKKKVVFVAGTPSHGPGSHEHNAGCMLLARLLNEHMGDSIHAVFYKNGWPGDLTAFQNADALVMFCDGGQRHVGYWHRRQINYLASRGIGLGAIHYAVEMTPGETNNDLISWIGGAFEVDHSVNPHWVADFSAFPRHPAANGVEPFSINDEWYFNMRFPESMKGVTPILSAVPPASTMERPDGHHSGNATVRKMVAEGLPQHVCWVVEREDGGRGFGFTGAHYHANWANNSFRKTVLNAITWIAGADVPAAGVSTPDLTAADIEANIDPDQNKKKPGPKSKKTAQAGF